MTELNTPGPGPAISPDPRTDTGPDIPPDGPVLEGNVVRVDQPGHDRPDWLADLADLPPAPRTGAT